MTDIRMRATPKNREITRAINAKASQRVGTATTTEGRLDELERQMARSIVPAVTTIGQATVTLTDRVTTVEGDISALDSDVSSLDTRVDTLEQNQPNA